MPIQVETVLDLAAPEARVPFPARDYILLPLLSMLTVVALFGAAEIATRFLWPKEDNDVCLIRDSIGGYHARPNCTVRLKNAEGLWANYHYNECGYRTDASCGPKPPGALRIALLGSSVAQGLNIPYEQTFATRAARELARVTRRDVQIENLGMQNVSPLYCYRRLSEALALQPDLIVYVITPFDLEQRMEPLQLEHRNDPNSVISTPAIQYRPSRLKLLQYQVNESRAVLVAQHFLFSDSDFFLRVFMNYGDKADYLRQPLTPSWQARFSNLNLLVTDMASRLHHAGVPLIVMAVPSRPEAVLASTAHAPPHTDPFAFSRLLQDMTLKAGAKYVNAVEEFSRFPHSEQFFYVVDQHVTPEGHAVLSRALVRTCLDGSIPAFKPSRERGERTN